MQERKDKAIGVLSKFRTEDTYHTPSFTQEQTRAVF